MRKLLFVLLAFSLIFGIFSGCASNSPDISESNEPARTTQMALTTSPSTTAPVPTEPVSLPDPSASVSPSPSATTAASPTSSPTTQTTTQPTSPSVETTTPAPSVTPSPVPTDVSQPVDHVILCVCYVTKEWSLFTDVGGWQDAVEIKEAGGVKYYQATIWEDTLTVNLYAFPNGYNSLYGDMEGLSTEKKVEYRESFRIASIPGVPAEHKDRSGFMVDAFTEISGILVDLHPDSTHNLIYSGHGIFGGELFEMHLLPDDSKRFLHNWTNLLGHKLGFIDMGDICQKGSFQDLETFFRYADYYIATDSFAGCSVFNDFTPENYNRTNVLYNYPRLLSESQNMEAALMERVNLARLRYELSTESIFGKGLMNTCCLFSCSEFALHKDAISDFMKGLDYSDAAYVNVDIRDKMVKNNAGSDLLQKFDSLFIHKVDSSDMGTWTAEYNGLCWLVSSLEYFPE